MPQWLEVDDRSEIRKLTISGRWVHDLQISPMVLEELDEALDEFGDDPHAADNVDVRVDFANCSRIGSEGISGLMRINRHLRPHNLPLILFNVPPMIREVLRVTRVDRVLRFADEPAPSLLAVAESFH